MSYGTEACSAPRGLYPPNNKLRSPSYTAPSTTRRNDVKFILSFGNFRSHYQSLRGRYSAAQRQWKRGLRRVATGCCCESQLPNVVPRTAQMPTRHSEADD